MVFESRVEHLKNRTLSKPERIRAMIDQKIGKITKKEIMDDCPDISETTVERTLTEIIPSIDPNVTDHFHGLGHQFK